MLSNISPNRQYPAAFLKPNSEKEIFLGAWVPSWVQFCKPVKPVGWGSATQGSLFSCVKTTPQPRSFALQQLCCLSDGFSSCLNTMTRSFWTAGGTEFMFVQHALTKCCFYIKTSLAQGLGNSLVVNLSTRSGSLSRKTHLRTISQGFVQNTSH